MAVHRSLTSWILATLVFIVGISSSFASLAQNEQTPWQHAASGSFKNNVVLPSFNVGYEFTPQKNGRIVSLGGLFKGNKNVRLYDDQGTLLAVSAVYSNRKWAYNSIAPVSVQAGRSYTIAVETGITGTTLFYGAGFPTLPMQSGDIRIERSVTGIGARKPNDGLYGMMLGQADIVFIPDQGNALEKLDIAGSFPSEAVSGQTTDVFLDVENISSDSVGFVFPTAQEFDIFVINSQQQVVKSWSHNKTFSQIVNLFDLLPGETITVGGDLELVDDNGVPLPAGDYTLVIKMTAYIEDDASQSAIEDQGETSVLPAN